MFQRELQQPFETLSVKNKKKQLFTECLDVFSLFFQSKLQITDETFYFDRKPSPFKILQFERYVFLQSQLQVLGKTFYFAPEHTLFKILKQLVPSFYPSILSLFTFFPWTNFIFSIQKLKQFGISVFLQSELQIFDTTFCFGPHHDTFEISKLSPPCRIPLFTRFVNRFSTPI